VINGNIYTGVSAVRKTQDGFIEGASDLRKGGVAAAY
jgi:hypothetical protein